jgi:glutathione synthase/RimK-type ligase-like ATP-grasp enzyme
MVPYRVPDEVASKVVTLMNRLDLETGSLDLIRAVDGKTYFLEVNPVGQFGMVSKPCNYHLERRVAEYLMEKDAS